MERVGPYVLVQPIYQWGWADVFLSVEAPGGRAQRVFWWARLAPDLPWGDTGFVHRLEDLLSTFRQTIQDPVLTFPIRWDFTAEPPYMVFEPIPGKSLREVLQAGRDQLLPMSIDQALACTHQLLMVLQTLHELTFQGQPAFHGTLSPTQVFVTYEGQLHLVYGGIPQVLAGGGRVPLSVRQALAPYLAPEQQDGTPGSPTTDVYTASLLCLELLTNRPLEALPADLSGWLMNQTVYLRTGEVVHLPEDLQMLFLQSLQSDPHQRLQNIRLLKDPLDEKTFSGEYEASTFHLAFYLNALFRDFPEREHRHYQSLLSQDYSALFTPPPPPPEVSPPVPSEPPPSLSVTEEVVLYPQVTPREDRPHRGFPLLPVLIALVILAFGGGAIWLLQRRMHIAPPTGTPGPPPEVVALRQQLEENQRRIAELQQVIQQLQTAQSTGSSTDAADAQMQELFQRVQELARQNEELQRQLREKEKTTAVPPVASRAAPVESPESRPAGSPPPTPPSPAAGEKAVSEGASEVPPPLTPPATKHETPPSPPPTTPVTETPVPPPSKGEVESPPAPLPEFILEAELDTRIEPVKPCVPTDPRLNWIRNRYPGTHRVIGQIYLDESGQPLKVEILQTSVELLGEIARDAWMNCRFRRPTRGGQPVKAVITRVMMFSP